jgi:type IV pilus assembly protein PilX
MKHHFPGNERGAVLIVSLIFLVILTMLGVTAMSSTTFEERMAGNARDAALAQQAAEAALREARDEVLDDAGSPSAAKSRHLWPSQFDTTNADLTGSCGGTYGAGVCRSRKIAYVDETVSRIPVVLPDIPANVDWTETENNTNGTTAKYGTFSIAVPMERLSKSPRYIIELFCPTLVFEGPDAGRSCRLYRFTAVGWGKNPNTQVTVQENYMTKNPQ